MARKNIQYEYDGKEYSCHEERREWNGGPIEGKIYQIGILAPPGVKFFLNGNNIITIGPVGYFHLILKKLIILFILLVLIINRWKKKLKKFLVLY